MNKELLSEWLEEWTFKNRDKERLTHSLHRYPAMFLPELAQKIIEMYSNERDIVLDIFSGSGTAVLESIANKRVGIGIELNPLAYFISSYKISKTDCSKLRKNIEDFYNIYFNHNKYEIMDFENIDFWYAFDTKDSISKFLSCIECFNNNTKNFFKVCLSEIIREISFCNHGGFKMHRDKKKVETAIYNQELFLNKIKPIIERNYNLVSEYNELINREETYKEVLKNSKIYHHDTTKIKKEIKKGSVDLIITSPPYGDSRTTVAYGQFSRLSMQILGMDTVGESKITQIDNELLGGKTKGIDPYARSIQSLTIQNIQELFISRAKLANDKKEEKRSIERLKDILSFYNDLEKAIKNASYYLKKNKFFVLITASRVVHNTKLHTDQIISELAYNYGFKLKNIHYRDIHNKRMPVKVSATNVVGETAPTMTEESIIILKKIK